MTIREAISLRSTFLLQAEAEASVMEEGDTAGVLARIPKRQKLNIVGIGKVRKQRISPFAAYLLSQ